MSWAYGDVIVHREIAWGKPWIGIAERVVADTPERLVTYLPTGAPFGYGPGVWPTETGLHPWQPRTAWEGHGTLIVQRPGDAYAVWHFWTGDDRAFTCWYLNLQEPSRRTAVGYDTQDHELDVVVFPDGQWLLKDDEKMEQRIGEGRYSADEVVAIRALGDRLTAMVDAGEEWWNAEFTTWAPDPSWAVPELPSGWEHVEGA